MYSTEQEIDKTMSQWMVSKRFTADAKTNALIRQRVEEHLEAGGYVAVSHFERAYLELLNEDLIQPFRGSLDSQQDATPAIPLASLSVEEYRRLPAAVVVQKYRQNAVFRAQVDALIAKGLI